MLSRLTWITASVWIIMLTSTSPVIANWTCVDDVSQPQTIRCDPQPIRIHNVITGSGTCNGNDRTICDDTAGILAFVRQLCDNVRSCSSTATRPPCVPAGDLFYRSISHTCNGPATSITPAAPGTTGTSGKTGTASETSETSGMTATASETLETSGMTATASETTETSISKMEESTPSTQVWIQSVSTTVIVEGSSRDETDDEVTGTITASIPQDDWSTEQIVRQNEPLTSEELTIALLVVALLIVAMMVICVIMCIRRKTSSKHGTQWHQQTNVASDQSMFQNSADTKLPAEMTVVPGKPSYHDDMISVSVIRVD